MHDHDLLAALPPPHDDEPPSLRNDIVDELLDHLHCAFRREVLKDGDEAAAEQRVLARFGDPKKVARRLWWQAMWSRIMGKRILSGLQWLITLAVLVLIGLVIKQQSVILTEMNAHQVAESHWRQNLSMSLNDLRSRLPAPAAMPEGSAGGWLPDAVGMGTGGGGMAGGGGASAMSPDPATQPMLTIKLVQGSADGPPVTDDIQEMLLTVGNLSIPARPQSLPAAGFGGMPGGMPGMGGGGGPYLSPLSSSNGRFSFNNLEPDRYELKIKLTDGQHGTQPVLIRDATPRELIVVCPGPRKKVPVSISATPLPEDLQAAGFVFAVSTQIEPLKLGEMSWVPSPWPMVGVRFDPKSGKLASIHQREVAFGPDGDDNVIDVSQAPDHERVIFLLTGGVRLTYLLVSRGSEVYAPPEAGEKEIRTVVPGQNDWKLTPPDELFAAARASVPQLSRYAEPTPANVAEPAASTPPPAGKARIVVKLSKETKDGPTPGLVVINLLDEKGGLSLDHVKRPPIEDANQQLNIYRTGNQPEQDGTCRFDVEPGRYGISVLFRDGRNFAMRLKPVDAGETLTEHVICPPPATKTGVLITAPPVPEDLRRDDIDFDATLVSTDFEYEGRTWRMFTPVEQQLTFGQATGQPIRAGEIDLSQDKPADRQVFLPAGKYRIHYGLGLRRKEGIELKFDHLAVRPPTDQSNVEAYDHAISPTEKSLQIEIADDFWAEARKKLAELEAPK